MPTPTEKRLDELKGELQNAKQALADAAGFPAAQRATRDDIADIEARIAEQEKRVRIARRRNASARARGNAMRSFGLRRTADGWQ